MSDNKLENKIREQAGEIFGKDRELPSGHRERFERQLDELHTGRRAGDCQEAGCPAHAENVTWAGQMGGKPQKSGKVISLVKWLATSAAVAAVVAALVFLPDPSAANQPDSKLADIRNYYTMQLEEQVDATKQLIQRVDEVHREALLANIRQIENEPVPDVQITDDEYIVLIAGVYTHKIETLQNLQNIIKENI